MWKKWFVFILYSLKKSATFSTCHKKLQNRESKKIGKNCCNKKKKCHMDFSKKTKKNYELLKFQYFVYKNILCFIQQKYLNQHLHYHYHYIHQIKDYQNFHLKKNQKWKISEQITPKAMRSSDDSKWQRIFENECHFVCMLKMRFYHTAMCH